MQTFLPSKTFNTSAEMLDSKRLNKQILEGYQILKVLSSDDPKAAWRNHPAVKMWRGSEHFLYTYVLAMVAEADKRGIKTDKNMENLTVLRNANKEAWGTSSPFWYHDEGIMRKINTTHRANLYIKDSEFYQPFFYAVDHKDNQPCCDKCKYYWVTHEYDMSGQVMSLVA
jgi:phage I-like protein